jgi:zinc protease
VARALAGLILLLALPARADILAHEEQRLENGLRVFYLVDRRAPTVAVVTWYRVGSGDEVPGHTGLAHLFEHLMFKGSPHAADGVMDRLIEEAGGWTNAFTDTDRTVYVDVAAAGFLERALWLEADRMAGLAAALDGPKLDNQRAVVLNERRETHENVPYGMADVLVHAALWPVGHPYHTAVIGEPEDIKAATLDDAKRFFAAHYTPGDAVMVIAGDVDVAAARGWVARYFGWIPGGAQATRRAATAPPITKPIVASALDDVQVPRVYLTWRAGPSYSRDEAALELATAMLAGGKSSRLYQALVVEQRLAQDVFAGLAAAERGGEVQVVATAKPGVAPAKLIAAIDAEIARVGEPDELERAKNTREAHFLAGLADPTARAEQLAEYAILAGDPDFLARDLARYRAVTAAEVRAVVARTLRPDGRVVLTIAPRSADAH